MVTFKETHISRLYLTDTRVYKLKKPLDLGFLDFTTLERRHYFCEEEVRLNRRFAPDTYLGVVELRTADGRARFAGSGKLIDYAVCMRRLPEVRMLDRMIAREAEELPAELDRLALKLNAMFNHAEICRNHEEPYASVVARNCRENFEQTRALPEDLLSSEARQRMEFITERDLTALYGLFRDREAEGFVRDGHGDLHTGNICMTDPIAVYDCIEFNRRFRVADIAADLAFLLMDLEFRNRHDLSERLLVSYQALADDKELGRLLPFYKRYRAWIRGKVEGLLAGDPAVDPESRRDAAHRARRYFNLAMGYALPRTLILTAGLMGSGKTVLARALASATGAEHLRSDVIRKNLAGIPATQPSPDDYNSGLYTPAMHERTYRALRDRAMQMLAKGRSVIIDASFARPEQRQHFAALADSCGCSVWLLHLTCPDQVALRRLDERSGDASDGRRALYNAQKRDFSPMAARPQAISVDSTLDVDYNVQIALCRMLRGQENAS